MEQLVELGAKLGYHPRTTVRKEQKPTKIGDRAISSDNPAYAILFRNCDISTSKGQASRLEYKGKIWCVKVKDNRNLLVERNGIFSVSGNTDEVYGSLSPSDPAFTETTPYAPNSPYSASKAGSDHLVRAYYHTYGLPTIITNCSNNYGPYQFPEKLIPLMCINSLIGKQLPVYGDGQNVRDWLYVGDHCSALDVVIHKGVPGETYNIGGNNEVKNIDLVQMLCQLMDELAPQLPVRPCDKLIQFVKDRPGHDRRYAIDASKIKTQLGWTPQETIAGGLRRTVEWYLTHRDWWEVLLSEEYQAYYRQVYVS